MAGPGFGGCTMTLAASGAVEGYLESIEDYERIFGFKPETFVMSLSPGAVQTPSLVKR